MKEVVTFQTQYDTQADESAARVALKERLIADVALADATHSLLATLQSARYQRRYGSIDIPQNVHDHREQLAPLAESYGMIFVPHWKYVGKFQLQLENGNVMPDPVVELPKEECGAPIHPKHSIKHPWESPEQSRNKSYGQTAMEADRKEAERTFGVTNM